MLLFCMPLFLLSQNPTVSGVVTYFYNDYQGNKPDVGARVYLIDTSIVTGFNASTIDTFRLVNSTLYMLNNIEYSYNNYVALCKQYEGKKRYKDLYAEYSQKVEFFKEQKEAMRFSLSTLKCASDEDFKSLDKRVWEILNLVTEDNSKMRTVDGSGNYSITVKPGTYFVYIKSKNRTAINFSEVMGKIYCKKVKVSEGDVKDVSYNFDL